MTREKSFNVDATRAALRSIATGALVGAVACLTVLPVCWGWLRWAVEFVLAIVGLVGGMAAALPDPPEPQPLDPLGSLRRIASGQEAGTYLAACCAVVALCVLMALARHVEWRRWLYDGTWVGGRRAPGAPIHGDARLVSSPSELRRMTYGWREGRTPDGGTVAVGSLGDTVRLVDAVHCCVLAESGEGKSRRIALASCLANFLQGRSLVINDVKGELRAYLEPYFASAGTHRIVDVMFDAPASSTHFDPLARAKAAFASEGDGGAARELRELARCVVPATLRGQQYFTDGARNVFVGIALHLIRAEEVPYDEKTVMSVSAALAPLGDRTSLDRVSDLVASLQPGDPSLPFLAGLTGESGGAPGIISTLSTYLAEYSDGNVARMLHDDECDLGSVGEVPTVVFVSSSSATGNYKRLVQTFVSQALSALRETAANNCGRCPVPTVLCLDEAASLGRNERMIQDLGEMRSERISIQWFAQSLVQMQSVSGYTREEAETILDLLKDKVVLSCSNIDTARAISDSLGSYTALAESRSRTRGSHSGSTGTSEGTVRRPLITPDELTRWTGRRTGALVIHDGRPMALPSRDVTETFVGRMLGMTSHDAEEGLMRAALANRPVRNAEVPPVWSGPGADDASQAGSRSRVGASPGGYTPELP